ncbi:hypothetical protein GTA08_BOTSDO08507 [Neofusicoccum parvum]|uniref:Uncharacterized protein n=1 Tax=Neofusicoccum parvum TaxID=310453 RepID=A0ACB5SB43_9PEZI|nr:hypothetical protein GTA08_BOTSDO08507 [Neofusicoccum parvum]
MKGGLAKHSEVAEHIRDELMDWMDEQPILTHDIPCWTPNDLTAPIFRNMFLTCPPVTEIVVYFGTDRHRRNRFYNNHRLCRARLSCDDGVKIGHLIIALASYHTRIDWSCSDMRRLGRDSERPPPEIVGRIAWRFDDLHSIEVAYNRKDDVQKDRPLVNVSRECEGFCLGATTTGLLSTSALVRSGTPGGDGSLLPSLADSSSPSPSSPHGAPKNGALIPPNPRAAAPDGTAAAPRRRAT